MPKLDRKINDVYATVTRPVAIAVLRQISELCGWDYNRENILFRGEALHAKMSAANEQPPQVVDQDVKGPADGFIQLSLTLSLKNRRLCTIPFINETVFQYLKTVTLAYR